MIVDDLDIEGVALIELEADAPPRIDRHRPLPFPAALELVQTNTLERAEIVQAFGHIQCQQKINDGLEIQPAELIGLISLPDLARRCASLRPDHGSNILRDTVNLNSQKTYPPLPE